ncbi:MAG: sugar ABC transporter permease [Clostridiales bacterium]|nr:sugar ABC transporter permease [Clostridiales bacterium]
MPVGPMIYKKKWPAVFFLTPAFLFMLIFLYYPFFQNIVNSFFEIRQLGAPAGDYVGFENYLKLVPGLSTTDPNMMTAIKNTLLLMLCTVVFQVGIALVLALLVDTVRRGSQVFRTLFFFPIVVSATALGLLFNLLLMTRGPVNQLIESLGGEAIIFREQFTFLTMAVPVIWQYVGFYFVILATGLNNISEDIREAAEIDGATGLRRVRYITLPLLRNVLITCLTLSITGSLKVFDMPWVMFPPYFSDAYLTGTYMYYQTFEKSNVDYAAAIAVFIVLLGVLLSQASKMIFREKDY